MTSRCVGAVNAIFERYSFNTRNQQEHESFKDYYSALRGQVGKCEYGEFRDELLRDRIVGGIRSNSVRKVLLSKKDLTLSSAVDICLTSETAMHQASTMAAGSLSTTPSVSESESIFALHRQRTPQRTNSNEQQPQGVKPSYASIVARITRGDDMYVPQMVIDVHTMA